MSSQLIPLRAHHLRAIQAVLNRDIKDREEYARLMIKQGYAQSLDDPFIDSTWRGILDLFKDQRRSIVLIAREPDFICSACRPPKKADSCFTKNDYSRFLGRAFWPNPNDPRVCEDARAAEDYFFELNQPYSPSDLSMRLYKIQQFDKAEEFLIQT